jgi:DNA-binding IclR family transcriptional regulator
VQTLSEIQEAAGLASATTHRIVSELVEWGALERVSWGRYRIGMRLWQLGSLAPQARDLRDVALPFLQDLLDVTHEVVHLVVLDEGKALFIERLMGRPEVHTQSRVGRRLPLHATGPGKVLLAFSPPEVTGRVIAGGLPRMARNTITDPARLRRALDEICATGYCLSRDEMTDGASSVAVPVRGATGTVIAAISVVVPTGKRHLPALVPAVRIAAAGISRAMVPFTVAP